VGSRDRASHAIDSADATWAPFGHHQRNTAAICGPLKFSSSGSGQVRQSDRFERFTGPLDTGAANTVLRNPNQRGTPSETALA
jgi:hypothetical protein